MLVYQLSTFYKESIQFSHTTQIRSFFFYIIQVQNEIDVYHMLKKMWNIYKFLYYL